MPSADKPGKGFIIVEPLTPPSKSKTMPETVPDNLSTSGVIRIKNDQLNSSQKSGRKFTPSKTDRKSDAPKNIEEKSFNNKKSDKKAPAAKNNISSKSKNYNNPRFNRGPKVISRNKSNAKHPLGTLAQNPFSQPPPPPPPPPPPEPAPPSNQAVRISNGALIVRFDQTQVPVPGDNFKRENFGQTVYPASVVPTPAAFSNDAGFLDYNYNKRIFTPPRGDHFGKNVDKINNDFSKGITVPLPKASMSQYRHTGQPAGLSDQKNMVNFDNKNHAPAVSGKGNFGNQPGNFDFQQFPNIQKKRKVVHEAVAISEEDSGNENEELHGMSAVPKIGIFDFLESGKSEKASQNYSPESGKVKPVSMEPAANVEDPFQDVLLRINFLELERDGLLDLIKSQEKELDHLYTLRNQRLMQ